MQLRLVRNPDIISEIAASGSGLLMVGFAAETENVVHNGREKLAKKNLDLLFANEATATFNSDHIEVTAYTQQSLWQHKAMRAISWRAICRRANLG